MSPSPCRSPTESLSGAETGAALEHPQKTRGSDAPSPACARSPRRWAGSLQRGCPVPPEKQVPLLLLRLLHPLRPKDAPGSSRVPAPERSRHGEPRGSG